MKDSAPFVVYNASAGSGKTFALVKIYLSLLFNSDRNDAYRNILAITFTNKAVAEMKNRIVQNLIAFSQAEIPPKNVALLRAVMEETRLSEIEIGEKSQRILKSIVHNYAGFEVSTIDSFTNRVLRTFAKDLGLSSNFEVELDVESILIEAVDRVISRAGEDQELTKVLIDYAISKADDDHSWDISRDLYAISKLLTNENNYFYLEKLNDKSLEDFSAFYRKLKIEMLRLENEAVETSNSFFAILEENDLEQSDFSGGYIPKYFSKVQMKNFEKLFGAKWQETIAAAKLYPARISPDKKACIDNLQPQIAELFSKSKNLILQHAYNAEISKNLTQLSLLNSIQQEVAHIKKERNLLLISDFNKTIGASVKNQPVPFIYERLGERYRNYFIDEFQDTSQLQWENLIPLLDNSLSAYNENEALGTLTLVGDAKQAIYRWRGGKAEQFMALCAGGSPFSIFPKSEVLGANYRSNREIVQFNNSFFGHIAQYLGLEAHRNLYENAAQKSIHPEEGYVNISFVEAKNKEEKELFYPERTLEIIRNLEANNYSKKDICILVRKQKQGIAIADFLNENGVPIISSETLLIDRSPKVRFAIDLLAFSLNNENKELKAGLLSFLWEFSAPEMEQHQFISEGLKLPGRGFYEYLEKFGFYFDPGFFEGLPIYNAVEYLFRSFNLVENSNAYLQFFLDFVFDYAQSSQGGIPGFLEHWEKNKTKQSIVVPPGEDAVHIMTIHRAKGLEFPIVIYPFADEIVDDLKMDTCWVSLKPPMNDIPVALLKASKRLMDLDENASAELEELLLQKELDNLNLLYVACTRAERQLYVISEYFPEEKLNGKINKFALYLISFLKDLGRWDDECLSYDFGKLRPNISGSIEISETALDEKFISTSPSSHNLNLVTSSGALWGSPQEESIAFGTVLHEIMSYIGTGAEMEKALSRAVLLGLFTEGETHTFRKIINKILLHPDLKKFFVPEIEFYNEREIMDSGDILRPDRIILHNGKASIIDYKTGSELRVHEKQISRYAQAVENMGYTISEKILVYVNEEVTLKIV